MAKKEKIINQEGQQEDPLFKEMRKNYLSCLAEIGLDENLPRKKFEIGEEVILSNISQTSGKIVGYENGVYSVDYIREVHIPYTSDYKKVPTIGKFYFVDLAKKSTKEFNLPKLKERRRLIFYNSNIELLISKCIQGGGGVNFNPSYQRDIVWDDEQREKLLDAIFNQADIGKFVFVQVYNSDKYWFEVLDGKQRLVTILSFYLDKFKYKGYYYSEMNFEYRYIFNRLNVSVCELPDNLTEKEILEIFLLLNTTGEPMQKEHLDKIQNLYSSL